MKGQLSYIIKPISLVITIVLILLLYNSISSFGTKEKIAQQDLDTTAASTNTLLVLANSPLCLAYVSPQSEGEYANIVDVNKLDYFASNFSSKEPECARSFEYGWRVTVKEIMQSSGVTIFGKNWSFGATNFSLKADNPNVVPDFTMPIAIHYSDRLTRPGLMTIHLESGELEKIAGIVDYACNLYRQGRLTKSTVQLHTSFPLTYDSNSKSLCQVGKINSCRVTDCKLDFNGYKSSGNYVMKISFDGDMEVIS